MTYSALSRTVERNSLTPGTTRDTYAFTPGRSRSPVAIATKPSRTQQLVKPTRKPTGDTNALVSTCEFSLRFVPHTELSLPPSPLKPYCCSTCGKSYRQISLLNLHRRRHTGEARYSCDVCGKLFTTSGNLKRHQLVHSGEKPYHCDFCGKAFSDPTAKMRHLETHDTDKGNKCPHCDKRFSQVRSV